MISQCKSSFKSTQFFKFFFLFFLNKFFKYQREKLRNLTKTLLFNLFDLQIIKQKCKKFQSISIISSRCYNLKNLNKFKGYIFKFDMNGKGESQKQKIKKQGRSSNFQLFKLKLMRTYLQKIQIWKINRKVYIKQSILKLSSIDVTKHNKKDRMLYKINYIFQICYI
ncbi:hypothetical protein TTHERM_001513283 (macronuclear) [Tetrahymena thermophila SB210]|uniref:Uncharacterized protein n=1 Tax=Tetrahymena thermophila (strain SB210) TaxID=312017 RepID=W7XB58_TETTS|nr:hypothetical protein TTHERM_001513283 [Tetrahymena thermophila SB210]EWS70911.1 hypothetical protein TTHERM_001513283 [Tetrahymena thermophila SB210]|eukprot:XP_012656555.1 hypothetical protein TTHERM_001513283 [Tetrahymena thermophila SB210]